MKAAVINLAEHRAAQARCPGWCTVDRPHGRHLAATGAIAARMPGRFDLITVMVQQDNGVSAVDLRVSPTDGQPGALLDADTLDEVIAALTEARRHLTTSPRPVRHARAGWASTARPGLPPVTPGRAHLSAVAT